MPEITSQDVTRVAKDVLYVSVGLGVIAFQKAQVQRVELTKVLKGQVDEAKGQLDHLGDSAEGLVDELKGRVEALAGSVDDRVKMVEERLDALEERLEALRSDIEVRLPEPARELVQQALDTAKDAREQLLSAVSRAA